MAQQTLEQFGQTIKQKYPQYNDISDAELGTKMLAKYPQYKDMVSTSTPKQTLGGSLAQGAKNFALGFGGEIAGAGFGLGELATKGVQLAAKAQPTYGSKTLENIKGATTGYLGKLADTQGKLSEGVSSQAQGGWGTAGKVAGIGYILADSGILKSGKNLATKGIEAVKGLLTKTPEQIMATAEENIPKLSSAERSYYFSQKKTEIETAAKKAEDLVKSNLLTKTNTAQKEAETLAKQLKQASTDEVISLRPKITKALGEQSAQYRQLVEQELAPFRDVKVNQSELGSFIDNKYAADPDRAMAIKSKLKISPENTPVKVSGEKLPVIQTGGETTIGKIYDQSQSLKQTLGTAAKKGSRVYSADEKLIDDAVSSLTDYMKSQGADLKAARTFWAKYAPVRDQLISEGQPFNQAGTKTAKLAGTLTKAAKGVDPDNANFIKATEKLIGQPLAKEQTDIVSKLNANQKQQLADKFEAEVSKAEIAAKKGKTIEELNTKEFRANQGANQAARAKEIFKKLLIGAAGATGAVYVDKTIKKFTGFGI